MVNANCLVSATALDFLGYDGTTTKTGNFGHPRALLVRDPLHRIAEHAGAGTFAQRLLSNSPTNKLQYNLYTTASSAGPIWGDGTNSTATRTGTGAGMASGSAQPFTVYGELPDNAFNQAAPAGSYTDTDHGHGQLLSRNRAGEQVHSRTGRPGNAHGVVSAGRGRQLLGLALERGLQLVLWHGRPHRQE